MKKVRKRTAVRLRATPEWLEARLCLATASVGWDGPGQGSAELTYYIGPAPSYLSRADVTAALETALGVWADVVDIEFTAASRSNLRDSIDLEFGRIDGPDGTLAQAYFPDDVNRGRIAGDVLFDSAERWEIGNAQGRRAFDLVLIAVHEIGHALGLEHSDAFDSVMADGVSPDQFFQGLARSDVEAALALYAPALVQPAIRGDFDGNGTVDSQDVKSLFDELVLADPDLRFDLTGDGLVDTSDRDAMIVEVLGSTYGDANFDRVFDSADLIQVLQAGKFRSLSAKATWEQGDWDGDGVFDTKDVLLALQRGAYRGDNVTG
jgi:hypothetical protein